MKNIRNVSFGFSTFCFLSYHVNNAVKKTKGDKWWLTGLSCGLVVWEVRRPLFFQSFRYFRKASLNLAAEPLSLRKISYVSIYSEWFWLLREVCVVRNYLALARWKRSPQVCILWKVGTIRIFCIFSRFLLLYLPL